MGSLDGRTLGHFRVERLIGSGGMGAVYEAVDEQLERQVALKVLLTAGDAGPNRKRFLREARLAAKLTHPNIATVFEVGEFENHLYIVMELLEGQSLRKLLSSQRLATEESLGLARDIARALARAHATGVTHRDIKPENVFVTSPAPNVLHGKVLDFGLARQQRDKPRPLARKNEEHTATDTTAPGDVLGTPGYWSPEQATAGEVDARTDIYSFGMVLYEMLTGRQAFRANSTVALVLAVTRHEPTPIKNYVPTIAPELEALVARCIAKNPAQRFADGSALLEAVEEIASSLGRASSPNLDDVTAADKAPPVAAPAAIPRAPDSRPVAAPTPGPTTLDDMPSAIVAPVERFRLFAAIGAGLAVAGLVLILVTVVWGSSDRSNAGAAGGGASAALGPTVAVPGSSLLALPSLPTSPVAEAVQASAPAPDPPPEPTAESAAPTVVAPSASIIPTPLAVAVPAVATAAPARRPSAAAANPSSRSGERKGDCAQPFTVDAKGVRIPKLHCL